MGSRFSTESIIKRLLARGFVYEADFTWVEKRKRQLHNQRESAAASKELIRIEAFYGLVTTACPGDAHSNPYIDTCLTCAPRWGFIVDRFKVRSTGLVGVRHV